MLKDNIDIKLIQERIQNKKKEMGLTTEQKKQSRDSFLTELLHSRHTGQRTKASEKIKVVEQVSDKVGADGRVPSQYSGKKVDPSLLNHVNTPTSTPNMPQYPQQQYPQQQYPPQQVGMQPERENLYDAQVNQLYNQYKNGAVPTPQVQPNQVGMLTEQQVSQMVANQGVPNQAGGLVTEQVGTAINSFINDNMGVIVEQAMKNTVMEMYSIERIKKTLDENRDLIQTIVIDTIKMLSERKKAKSEK